MPRLIEAPTDAVIDLPDLIDWCESAAFDPGDQDSLAAGAPMLKALANNRDFLGDMAVAALKERCAGQRATNPYGGQVMLLSPPTGRYLLRAAFWPAATDHVVRMSGPAAFLYGVPHDHGFDFLTVGYLGPGYESDYFDHDGSAIAGRDGEPVNLRFVERSTLGEGRVLLYRANRDVHAQRPPARFSVSLNILAMTPDQGWRRQFRFDLARRCIAEQMTVSSAQLLLDLAVGCGSDEALSLAHDCMTRHPVDAMRATAWAAIGAAIDDPAALIDHRERGARSGSPLVRAAAEHALRTIRNEPDAACAMASAPASSSRHEELGRT